MKGSPMRPTTISGLRKLSQLAVLTAVAVGASVVSGVAEEPAAPKSDTTPASKTASKTKAKSKSKHAITNPKFDAAAEKVALFDGMDEGKFEVTVIAKDEKEGNVLIENKTDKPLTVVLPDAIVGVPVLKQFGGVGMGVGGGGVGGVGGQGQNQFGGAGGQQNQGFGGGFGGGGGGGGFGGGGFGGGGFGGGGLGGGFFSIPPEKVVRVPYTSVCLNHGKAEPTPKTPYRLVRVESYTSDAALQELIRMVGTGRIDKTSAQAAAWHLTDKMSWQQLASKEVEQLGGQGNLPYFTRGQLQQAQTLVAQAVEGGRERAEKEAADPNAKTRKPVIDRTLNNR